MIALGATVAAVAVASLVLALRPSSPVARRLRLVAPIGVARAPRWRGVAAIDLRQSGIGVDPERFLGIKIASGLAVALGVAVTSLVAPLGPAIVALAGYAGFVAPSMVVERRAATRRAEAERAGAVLVERVEALVAAGRPPETALALLMRRASGAALLDRCLRGAHDSYSLGAPLFRTLAARAREERLATLASFAEDLERARDLGTGSLGVIRERRESSRAAERARSLEAASQVEGKLMLVLVLCYLPALILLVVVPLFVGLLEGLFA